MLRTICFIFLFEFTFLLQAQQGAVIDGVIAVVGAQILLKSEFEQNLTQYKSQGATVDDEMECRILEDLLFQKLMLNQANLDSVVITDKQVDAELKRRIDYFVSQIGSERALEEYYKKSMEEIRSELRETLEDQMIVQKMQSDIVLNNEVTPSEVQEYYNNQPIDSLPMIREEVEVSQIVIIAPPNRRQVEEARQKLNDLRERIVNGEDFSTMAILYSEDPGTARQGGELGFVGRAEVDPAFADAAFKLKGNEVSRIVQSEFGLHVIQLIEKKGEKINVRHILMKPKIEGKDILKAKEVCDSLRNAIVLYDSLTFAMAARRHSDHMETKINGGLTVNPYSGSSLWDMEELEPSVYVAIENLKEDEISETTAYSTRDGKRGYAIYSVLKRREAHRANLRMDYQMIQDAAKAAKENDVVNKWIKEKLNSTYTLLNGDYQKCNFEHQWDKVN